MNFIEKIIRYTLIIFSLIFFIQSMVFTSFNIEANHMLGNSTEIAWSYLTKVFVKNNQTNRKFKKWTL